MAPRPCDIKRRRPLLERIHEKTQKPLYGAEGCWVWTGAMSQKRDTWRPVVWYKGAVISVARVMCTLANGVPPTRDHQAGHICPGGENAKCVRPTHLKWMSDEENRAYKAAQRAARETPDVQSA